MCQVTDKLKVFNALKTKLRDAQSEFFKALSDAKDSQQDGFQEQYKFVALIKEGDGKLMLNDSKDVPSIEGGFENKHFLSIKEKMNFMKDGIASIAGSLIDKIRMIQENSLQEGADAEKTKADFCDLMKEIEEFTETNVSIFVSICGGNFKFDFGLPFISYTCTE